MSTSSADRSFESASQILGVLASSSEQELRSAYLLKVQQHPPDRDPEQFEKIRDAYDQLRNPARQARAILDGPLPDSQIPTILEGIQPRRAFVETQLWLELLKENRS